MGVRIIAEDSDAESMATEYSSPVRRGLQEIHFLNTSQSKAAHNYAPDKKSGSIVGSPVVSADRMSAVGLVSFVQTATTETSEMTAYIVAKTSDDGSANAKRPAFFGTFSGVAADGGLSYGVTFYLGAVDAIAFGASYGNSASDIRNIRAYIPPTNVKSWALYELIVDASGVYMNDLTNNAKISAAPPAGLPRRPSTNKLRIGSAYNDLAGSCDVALFQSHSVVLTEIERTAVIADLRARALDRGITV